MEKACGLALDVTFEGAGGACRETEELVATLRVAMLDGVDLTVALVCSGWRSITVGVIAAGNLGEDRSSYDIGV